MRKKRNFLVFTGNPGIGKTHFCAALMEFCLSQFESFRYWKEQDLLERIRSSMSEFKGDYFQTLKLLIDDDLVILDDIGSSGVNDWREEILFKTIDERYNSLKPTIITSNFSRGEFKKLYHPRIYSRIYDHENFIINFEGEDFRKPEKYLEATN